MPLTPRWMLSSFLLVYGTLAERREIQAILGEARTWEGRRLPTGRGRRGLDRALSGAPAGYAGWSDQPGRICPHPLMWDGGSPSYYTHDWNPSTDYTTWSPQIEFQNLVFMQQEAYRLNPEFWLEFSVWDGYDGPTRASQYTPKRDVYQQRGQTYDPHRYAGFVQFGMWLLRPRVVREYRGWTFPVEEGLPYFMAIVQAVDRVHLDPVLREFWRHGKLVPNRARQHPYRSGIPEAYAAVDRWFLLDADANPPDEPWSLSQVIPVFSLALMQGASPERRWLVYAHAPLGDRQNVQITIPDYRQVTLDVSRGGSFSLLDEQTGEVSSIESR
jgi:hypothetical protein